MNKNLRTPSLSRTIMDYIKDYIVNNKLQAGDPLPSEGQLADELGVSRSPVREAVKALQSLGIVEARQGEGLFVREWNFDPVLETLNYGMRINPKTLAELYQIRVWLEMAVIGDAVKLISAEDIMELDILMLRWEQAINQEEPYVEFDQNFHELIFGVLKNETLMKLFKVFWVAFENYGDVDLIMAPDTQRVINEHRDVLEAVKQRNPDLARKTLLQQFIGFKDRIDEIARLSTLVETKLFDL
jgi:DNA-binding FadR family transcriptional regulator